MALNTKRIASLKKPGRHADQRGLYLQISDIGAKSWVFRYERAGRERMLGLGPLHTIGLAQARERARKAREQLIDGIDPIEAKKAAKAALALEAARRMTFEDAAKAYYAAKEREWRNRKHAAQFLSTLQQYAFPKIGRLSVADVDVGMVLKVLEPIWHEKTETADRVRQRIKSVLDWATVRGLRKGDNPAQWQGYLDKLLPPRAKIKKVKHHAALPYAELPTFMNELRTREGMAARALEFTVLTAARTGETIGARWSEIDRKAKCWTVPAERIKTAKEHKVPLSDRAIAIIESLPREKNSPFVFVGTKTGSALSDMAMATTLRRMDRSDITVHGFRSAFRDWAAERTGYPNHVVEMALAHAIGNKVERAYRRGDLFEKRRRLMADWARHCSTTPEGAMVVSLQGAR